LDDDSSIGGGKSNVAGPGDKYSGSGGG